MRADVAVSRSSALNLEELVRPFERAAEDVFRTMLASHCRSHFSPVEAAAELVGQPSAIIEQQTVASLIRLNGKIHGAVAFVTSHPVAFQIVERLTGIETAEVDELMFDAVRELANMIGGHGKRELEHLELLLGIPQIVPVDALSELSREHEFRVVMPLETELGPCGLQVAFRSRGL